MSAHRIVRTAELVLEPEVRSNGDLRLKGYAAIFNAPSQDIGFREVLEPGAFRDALRDKASDVLLLWQHSTSAPLARQSARNLKVYEDERGLAFEATLPKTQLAQDAHTLTRAGVVKHMSFAFSMDGGQMRTVERGGETWRYVSRVGRLYEISLVSEPAYLETSVEPRSAAALEAIRRHARPRDDGPYGPDKPHSYFRDLAAVAEARLGADVLKSAGARFEGKLLDRGGTHPIHGTLEEASNRLDEAEKRAISAVNWAFIPSDGGFGFIGELFAIAARAKAALASRLPNHELPKDLNVRVPRFSSGASVGYGQENQPLPNTDPATALDTSNVATIDGFVDAARQDLDQTPGHVLDRAIAADLGGAWAAMLEQEVLNGDGAAGEHLLGLLNITGSSLTTYTDAAPTPTKVLAQVGASYSATSTAYGAPLDAIAMHSRRRSWVEQKIGQFYNWPAPIIESQGIPTNLGAGTQDAIVLLALEEIYLLTSEIHFDVLTEIQSSTLGVRFRAYGYAALLSGRLPASIGVLAGTGLAAPVF